MSENPQTAPPAPSARSAPLSLRDVFTTWSPLAGSWLLMGLELPVVSAVMARLPHATVSLAAYGGVVFPLSLLIEAPILMLLTASTALARDMHSYRVVRRFMFVAAGSLTALHALVAFTPLFDLIAVSLIGVPDEVREPARTGLRIMLPWTLAIAYRRTQQGLLIRFERARAVTWGTMVRLTTLSSVLATGYVLGRWPGIVVGTCAVAGGVIAEALYARFSVDPVRRGPLAAAPAVQPPLTMRAFVRFYAPLSFTPLLHFLAMPLAAAAMSRMPSPLESLAAWPVLSGSVFTLRSVGFAFNEVAVSLLDRQRPVPALRRFAVLLGAIVTALLLIGAATPAGLWWFGRGSALAPDLARMAWGALWLLLPMGAASVWQSYHQGALVHVRDTRAITESMAALLLTTAAVLGAGVALQPLPGLHLAALATTAGGAAQIGWLAHRSRKAFEALQAPKSP